MDINKIIRKYFLHKKWRHTNAHNSTYMDNIFPPEVVRVGNYTYGPLKVLSFDQFTRLIIGNFCSIAPEVAFMLSADHRTDLISSFPFKVKVLGNILEGASKGNISIGDDVWIGYRSTILSGVHIGQGAVVAAGAVVSKDVPPYSVVGGVPAKIIRNRFTEPVIEYLLTLDYSKVNEKMVRNHAVELYLPIAQMRLEEITKQYDWFPKRES